MKLLTFTSEVSTPRHQRSRGSQIVSLLLAATVLLSVFAQTATVNAITYTPNPGVETLSGLDSNIELATALRHYMNLNIINPDQAITAEDMKGLTNFRGGWSGISSLAGLEHATNLTTLNLDGNNISDISPLGKLTKLKHLGLGNNQIINIEPLSGLTNLTELGLSHNQISNIYPLHNLTKLVDLWLNDNDLQNIWTLSRLTNLKRLLLANNPRITEFSPIAALIPNLTHYDIFEIEDDVLRGEIQRVLDVDPHNTISPADMRRLDHLDLAVLPASGAEKVRSLKGLEYATSLRSLDLDGNAVSDLSPLRDLPFLRSLALEGNGIRDISLLSGLPNLKWLYLSDNRIRDVSPLRDLRNLTVLYLSNNDIRDISPLGGLRNLTQLYLSDNDIRDISPLRGLPNLRTLYLQRNYITDFSPIAPLLSRDIDVNIADQNQHSRSERSAPENAPPDSETQQDGSTPEDDTDAAQRSERSAPENALPDSETQQDGSTPEDDTDAAQRSKRSLPEAPQDSAGNGLSGGAVSSGLEAKTGLAPTGGDTLDVNRDGKVDSDDVDIVARFVGVPKTELAAIEETENVYPDVDGDGDVDEEDVRKVSDPLGDASDERRRDSEKKGKSSQASGSKTQ
ncbi:MAG: leucine-rich repeat domain-containing protein [Candidatus Poribacteria bacterium]|nr:leucine-rich repeat domain-containing protein [Candidatus Poribacteria bacterium]